MESKKPADGAPVAGVILEGGAADDAEDDTVLMVDQQVGHCSATLLTQESRRQTPKPSPTRIRVEA